MWNASTSTLKLYVDLLVTYWNTSYYPSYPGNPDLLSILSSSAYQPPPLYQIPGAKIERRVSIGRALAGYTPKNLARHYGREQGIGCHNFRK